MKNVVSLKTSLKAPIPTVSNIEIEISDRPVRIFLGSTFADVFTQVCSQMWCGCKLRSHWHASQACVQKGKTHQHQFPRELSHIMPPPHNSKGLLLKRPPFAPACNRSERPDQKVVRAFVGGRLLLRKVCFSRRSITRDYWKDRVKTQERK